MMSPAPPFRPSTASRSHDPKTSQLRIFNDESAANQPTAELTMDSGLCELKRRHALINPPTSALTDISEWLLRGVTVMSYFL